MHAATILSHQGGWDEIVMVTVPIVVFGALLGLARRRAIKIAEASESTDPTN